MKRTTVYSSFGPQNLVSDDDLMCEHDAFWSMSSPFSVGRSRLFLTAPATGFTLFGATNHSSYAHKCQVSATTSQCATLARCRVGGFCWPWRTTLCCCNRIHAFQHPKPVLYDKHYPVGRCIARKRDPFGKRVETPNQSPAALAGGSPLAFK